MQSPISSRWSRWIGCAAAATVFALGAHSASAQSQAVTNLVVAFPAGGPADFIARVLAEHLGQALDTRVIVENKPGGNGSIAASTVKRNKADGQTLWLTSVGAVAINPHLYSNMAYAPGTDFVPVSTVVNSPEVFVVRADSPYTDAQSFIAAAKEGKGLTMASTGAGSVPHLALALLNEAAGVNIAHVPYRGAAPAVVDVIGGHVDGFIGDVPPLIPHIQSGKLRALGASAEKRLPMYPDLPTLAEQGLANVFSDNWYALFVKAGTPDDTVARINAALNTVLKKPAVIEAYQAAGLEVMGGSAQELKQLLQADTQRWGAVIERAGIVAD